MSRQGEEEIHSNCIKYHYEIACTVKLQRHLLFIAPEMYLSHEFVIWESSCSFDFCDSQVVLLYLLKSAFSFSFRIH